jgi:hypothetical protein
MCDPVWRKMLPHLWHFWTGFGKSSRRTEIAEEPVLIAALYVEKDGVYANLPGVDVWDESRDARLYAGPDPVVAHLP